MGKPRYLIETFGCQMNVHDSQRMEEALLRHGWVRAEGQGDADLIVFNTCSVREKAEHKLRSEAGRLRPLKRARPELVIAIAGCVAQQEGEQLLRSIPHVDVVVGPDNLAELPMLAETVRLGGPPAVRTVWDLETPTFLPAAPTLAGRAAPVSTYVTTMKGCDERCSFCIVPYTRGPERYRSMDEIVAEVAALVDAGVREVTLLGQTVNSWLPPDRYQPGTDQESEFGALLRRIARDVPRLGRLRYTSPHPRHLNDDLVAAHAELDVLARHLHLPVQSGSDRQLRRMIRRYTRAHYLERTRALRAARPGLTLSTDVIVGFPGETREDFEETLSLVREAGFVALFGFKFSPRPDTPALKLGDDVPEAEKDERLARLFEVIEVQQRAHLQSLVGSTVRVLIEGDSRPSTTRPEAAKEAQEARVERGAPARMMGRSERNEIVHVEVPEELDPTPLVGRFLELTVVSGNAHSLVSTLPWAVTRTLRPRPPSREAPVTLSALEAPSPVPDDPPGRRKLPVLGGA